MWILNKEMVQAGLDASLADFMYIFKRVLHIKDGTARSIVYLG